VNWIPTILVIVGLLINFGMLIIAWQSIRGHQKVQAVKTQEIHVLVNSKLDAALARGIQLKDTLEVAGVEVPSVPEEAK
jgi:hypothetical protein